jgi:hypothetical protein
MYRGVSPDLRDGSRAGTHGHKKILAGPRAKRTLPGYTGLSGVKPVPEASHPV